MCIGVEQKIMMILFIWMSFSTMLVMILMKMMKTGIPNKNASEVGLGKSVPPLLLQMRNLRQVMRSTSLLVESSIQQMLDPKSLNIRCHR
mmetsp:Transcript_19627/g.45622  ORF Transcript_19627/g.45622 Transcript_19627/m.45622 type:complete len:90 (+) Transcript_19627:557-826(+)